MMHNRMAHSAYMQTQQCALDTAQTKCPALTERGGLCTLTCVVVIVTLCVFC